MAYTVLARRYRSQTFEDVVGQDAIARTLKNAIKSNHIAHAYLFTGTRGVGKTTMARILAKSLNCLKAEGPTDQPCLECDSCTSVNTGDDIDVIEIDGASNNSVENIRELRQNAIYRPARARFKIYIIDEVHMLSTSAFNALLKILEEPPEHVKFIFATTEPNKVLPTIQSRCQRFDFVHIHPETIAKQLRQILDQEKVKYEEDLILQLARLANGSMRDALSLLDQLISTGAEVLTVKALTDFLGRPDRTKLQDMAEKMSQQDGAAVLTMLDELVCGGMTAGQICDAMIELMRDMMILKTVGKNSNVLFLTEQEQESLLKTGQGFDLAGLVYAITALEKLRWSIRSSETGRILLEAALLRLTMTEHFLGLDQLARSAGSPASSTELKKNKTPGGEPVNSVPAAVVPPGFADSSGPPSLDTLRKNWPQLLLQVQASDEMLSNYLAKAVPVSCTSKEVKIEFAANAAFALNMCQKKINAIAAAIKQCFGCSIGVGLCMEDTSQSRPAAPSPVPAALNQAERAKILDDPRVQMVLREMSATPKEISRMEMGELPPPSETGETA